ncbi:hypothetical protein ACJMK2_013292, partial [Sinanodonta woodiana]
SVSPSEKFLQRGTEKSREILSSFGTSGFYSSTPAKPSVLFTYSKKRTPGLMPDPKPNKPLLSDNISYSWSQQKTSQQSENKPIQTLHGFSNLGNTCYMNAILQSLYGLETFATDLLYTNHKLMKNFAPQSLYYSLAKLLNSRRTNIPDTIRRDLLRNVKTAISSTAKRFSGYQQHDAHEFLCQVLDQLKEEVTKVGKATPSQSPSSSEGGVKQDYVNPTVTNFEFEVRHSITCFQCGEEVTKTEQYNDISVDLLKTRDPLHPPNLQQALDTFFRKECIEYTCEKCGHTKSEVAHKFVRLPRVFILHLKRYSYNCQISQNMKRGQSIGIPIYLTLQPHCEEMTIPPLPPQLQLVYASPLKSCSFFENRTDDTARRKLDYQASGFKFKRIRSSVDSDEESKQHSPVKKLTLEHAVKDGTLNKIPKLSEKPLDIITDEDSELEKVLELSRREAEERKQLSEKSSGIIIDEEDTELENILELSRREAEERKQMNENFSTDGGDDEDFKKVGAMSKPNNGKNNANDNDSLVSSMTEEEQINLAIQQSLMEPGFTIFNEFSNLQRSENGIGLSDHDSYSVGRKTEKVGFVNGKKQFHESGVNDVKNSLTKLTPKSIKDDFCLNYVSDDHEKLLCPISNTILNGNVAKIESDRNKSERDQSCIENKPHCFEVDKKVNIQCEQEKENGTHSVEFKSEQVDVKKENATQSAELPSTEGKIDDGVPDIDLTCQEVDVYPPDDEEELLPEVINNEKGELPYSYRLISIVNHVGTSSVLGHYISDVYDIKKRSWFSFDDSHVTRTTEQEVQSKRERTGYIFFYISKDIFDDLQDHHKLSVAAKV